jgi:aspartyl protease family protein
MPSSRALSASSSLSHISALPFGGRGSLSWRQCAVVTALLLSGQAVQAQDIAFSGRMGSKALLVIGGQPRVVGVGETQGGVKLLEVTGEQARVERDGQTLLLRLGAAPTTVAGAGDRSAGASRDLELKADAGGHFVTEGWINGKATRFMVDTGATAVSLSQTEAERLGLDWRRAPMAQANTANGTVPAHTLQLGTVRIGELVLSNVGAVVLPAQLPHVLLGNTFLSRVSMKRDNDTLKLEPKAATR